VRDPVLDQAPADPLGLGLALRGGPVNRKKPVTVTWELLERDDGPTHVVVDVDAPLRPFGVDPTPPRGTPLPGAAALANKVDDETVDDIELPVSDEQQEPL